VTKDMGVRNRCASPCYHQRAAPR